MLLLGDSTLSSSLCLGFPEIPGMEICVCEDLCAYSEVNFNMMEKKIYPTIN